MLAVHGCGFVPKALRLSNVIIAKAIGSGEDMPKRCGNVSTVDQSTARVNSTAAQL